MSDKKGLDTGQQTLTLQHIYIDSEAALYMLMWSNRGENQTVIISCARNSTHRLHTVPVGAGVFNSLVSSLLKELSHCSQA